jgi:hypothetical protein
MSYPPGERRAARVLGHARRRISPAGQVLDVDRQAGVEGAGGVCRVARCLRPPDNVLFKSKSGDEAEALVFTFG